MSGIARPVILAQARIQSCNDFLDSGMRRNDEEKQ
jgi:hypothetical protein